MPKIRGIDYQQLEDFGTKVGIGTDSKLAQLTIQQQADSTASGTTTANASTTITGVGSSFLTEVGLGDRISLSSAAATFATVTAIASATSLTVSAALGNGTTQTILIKKALFRADSNAASPLFVVNDIGNAGFDTSTTALTQLAQFGRLARATDSYALFVNSGAGSGSAATVGMEASTGNLRMWHNDARHMTFGTNNTLRLTITASGSATYASSDTTTAFAINASADSRALQLTSTSTATGVASTATLRIGNSSATNNNYQALVAYNSAGAFVGSVEFQNINHNSAGTQTGHIAFTTANAGTVAERMRLDNTGRLGIGTTPANHNFLDILAADTSVRVNIAPVTGTNAARYQVTTSAGVSLFGQENSAGTDTFTGATANATVIGSTFANNLQFGTNNNIRMTVDSTGQVGIGKAPAVLLDVTAPTAHVIATSSTGTNQVTFRAVNTGGTLYLGRDDSTGSGFAVGAYASVIWASGATNMAFGTNNLERMRINSVGDVSFTRVAGADRYVTLDGDQTNTGRMVIQAGAGSAAFGGSVLLYSHAHASKPGWVTIGLSSGAGGKFSINQQGLGGGTDLVVVKATGELGIGDTNPTYKLDVVSTATTCARIRTATASGSPGGNDSLVLMNTNGTVGNVSEIWAENSNTAIAASISFYNVNQASGGSQTGKIGFNTARGASALPTEAMSIDQSGKFVVGGSTAPSSRHEMYVNSGTDEVLQLKNNNAGTNGNIRPGLSIVKAHADQTAGAAGQHFIDFFTSTSTANGFISANGGNGIQINSGSDRRLKHDIASLSGSLAKIMELNPVTFKWKSSENDAVGFIAQELIEVLPHCVSATDDGEGEEVPEGTSPWSMTESGMIPHLVKALQEINAKCEALEARLAAANL